MLFSDRSESPAFAVGRLRNACEQRPRSAHGADTEIIATRSQYTVTFVRGNGRRHIQVILHAYSHAAEALVHFNLDCCAVV